MFERFGLGGLFEAVVAAEDVTRAKPDPEPYLAGAARLGVPPSACLVVEDSYNGVRAARGAGMTVVLVPNASVPPAPGTEELADIVLERLADLDPDHVPVLAEALSRELTRAARHDDDPAENVVRAPRRPVAR